METHWPEHPGLGFNQVVRSDLVNISEEACGSIQFNFGDSAGPGK